jgi:hypothetical protein
MQAILRELQGGDRRSIGRANEVVWDVLNDPALFEVVFRGALGDGPVVRMRCADAAANVTATHRPYLQPHKIELNEQVARIDHQEVGWHVAQLMPRLKRSAEERAKVVRLLLDYLHDESKLINTFAMQAPADLAEEDADLGTLVIELLENLVQAHSQAMKTRGQTLLATLKRARLTTAIPAESLGLHGGRMTILCTILATAFVLREACGWAKTKAVCPNSRASHG